MLLSSLALSRAESENPLPSSDPIAARVPGMETGSESDHLTGDWGGVRTRLFNRGVHILAGYTGEVLGNVSGGMRRGAVYEGLLEIAVRIDTGKLGLWPNGTFHVSS